MKPITSTSRTQEDFGPQATNRRLPKTAPLYVPRGLVESRAFVGLTGRAPQVLLIFYSKRRVEKLRRPGARGERFRDTNNGQIIFTYRKAEKDYGLTRRIFTRALDQLIARGFIDVTKAGSGLEGDASLYGLSDRWWAFGTAEFEERARTKGRAWSIPVAHKKVRCAAHKKVRGSPAAAHKKVRYLAPKPPAGSAQKGAPSKVYQAPLSEKMELVVPAVSARERNDNGHGNGPTVTPDARLLDLAARNRGRSLTTAEQASFLGAVLKARAGGATEPLIACYVLGAAAGTPPWAGPGDASAAAQRLLGSYQNAIGLPEPRTAVEQLLADVDHARRYLAAWTAAEGNEPRDHNRRVLAWAKVYAKDLAAAAMWPESCEKCT